MRIEAITIYKSQKAAGVLCHSPTEDTHNVTSI